MRKELLEIASEKKQYLKQSVQSIELEMLKLQQQLEDLNQQKQQLSAKFAWADSFGEENDIICPHCFIDYGKKVLLIPVPSRTIP